MLARSSSGPAGLTINTGAANSSTPSSIASAPGIFGSGNASTTQPASATGTMATTGGLFGAKPAPGGLFGGGSTTPATTTSTGGGLFGNNATAQPAPSAAGGLFGSGTPAQANTAATGAPGGLFGASTPAAQTTQAATGGLFGNKPATPAATGGGLFGNAATTQQQPSGGLFGGGNTTNTQQTSGGLFGQSAATPQIQQTGGLFGGQNTTAATTNVNPVLGFQQPKAQQTGGLFGQTTQAPAPGVSTVPAVQINYDGLRPRSRFDDLTQPLQSEIDLIDKGIQRVIKMRDEIGEFMPQHEKDIEQLGRDVQFVETKFKTVQDALNRDIQTVKTLQDMTKKNITDAQLSFKAADNLKLPTHYHQTGLFANTTAPPDPNPTDASSAHSSAQDLITYFNRICDDVEKYKKRLDEYRSQIERDMPGVENGLYEQIRTLRDRSTAPVQDQLSQVLLALRETGSAIVGQAGVIAETREKLSRLQAGFLDSGLYSGGLMS